MRGDASVVSALLKLVRFHALESAVVQLHSSAGSQVTPTDITTFLALFYNTVSDSDLWSFELAVDTHTRDLRPRGHSESVLRDLLAPILPIRSLRSFRLITRTNTIASLDDTDIRALATAWPRLEQFSLDRGSTSESSVSIDAIHHLYTHCTAL